jgi:hypothetical protein
VYIYGKLYEIRHLCELDVDVNIKKNFRLYRTSGCLLTGGPDSHSRPIHVVFVVDRVTLGHVFFRLHCFFLANLCGLVVRVPSYRSRGSGFDSRHYQIF